MIIFSIVLFILKIITGEVKEGLIALHPIHLFGEAIEVAELVVWLNSGKAFFITGSYYPIDNGYLAQ